MERLFPTLAPLPRGFPFVALALLPTAWALHLPHAAFPGVLPGDSAALANDHWLVHRAGLAGWISDDLHGYPHRTDRLLSDGFPLDELTSWPLCSILGLEAGMWAWSLGRLWLAGMAGAWLAGRWWGTRASSWVGGVAWQGAGVILLDVAGGRSGAGSTALLPIVFGAGVLAIRRANAGIVAGACAGVATAGCPALGLPLLLAAAGPSVLSRSWAGAASVIGAAALPLAPLVAWFLSGLPEQPGLAMEPWSRAPLSGTLLRPADLISDRVVAAAWATAGRPVGLALALLAAWCCRLRYAWWPGTLGALAAIGALGSELPGPVVTPWGLAQALPLVRGLWSVDRWWLFPSLAVALMAAGAARRGLAVLAGLAVAIEANVANPHTPGIDLRPSEAARRLAEAPDVPLLLLPLGGGRFRSDRLDLLDQVHHGRPLVNGTFYPTDLRSPDALLRAWRADGLSAILSCEEGGAARPGEPVGVREVWIDRRYLGDEATGRAYEACVRAVLTGWTATEEGPFTRLRG